MRHIPLTSLLAQIFADADGQKAKISLLRAHKKLALKILPSERTEYTKRTGPNKWKLIKNSLIQILGRKCWYTELEFLGGALTVDHYRPVCDYWWLAYDEQNYRLACPWANSPEHNATHGMGGGKGDNFPLLAPGNRARGRNNLRIEKPVILDPCNRRDCELLAFQADGRPVVNPAFANDPIAVQRVEQSKLLLNLDHPEFNSKREQLRLDIGHDVRCHEALAPEAAERETIRNRLIARLAPSSSFSTAARFYLQFHREHDWVQEILDKE